MHDHPQPFPPGIDNGIETLGCYSGLYSTKARVFYPDTQDQIRELFKYARDQHCRVTIRGGAHSFDSQSLGDDLVISMARFNDVNVDAEARRLHVGPGATWGTILKELEKHGLMPAVTVTTEHATAGGTLAGDCLSRFSPAFGKEGKHIHSFDMVTVESAVGDPLLHCEAPDRVKDPAQYTDGERGFAGAIGGLGYLGAVVAITYKVLPVKAPPPIRIVTRAKRHWTRKSLARALVPAAHEMDLQASDQNNPNMLDSIYSAFRAGRFLKTGMSFKSRVATEGEKRSPMILHEPYHPLRVPIEFFMRTRIGAWAAWYGWFLTARRRRGYVDDLAGYTFFMDGNVCAKEEGRRLGKKWGKWLGRKDGFKMQTIQQTFVVPSDPKEEPPGAEAELSATEKNLVEWLGDARDVFKDKRVRPTLSDVMYLPADDRFPLSATADLAGFAVSYAFETSNAGKQERIKDAFRVLSNDLLTKYQGRVYLVKNVHADPQTLYDMYYPNANRFFTWKEGLDPYCLLRNEFLDRTFGELVKCAQRPATPTVVTEAGVASP